MVLTEGLRRRIEQRFLLNHGGVHGPAHWDRVRDNGLFLAKHAPVDVAVVELFAWLHDSCRETEGGDPGHGHRAAEYATELFLDGVLELTDSQMDLLLHACRYHSHGFVDADITVQACWDADRLDLGRVGSRPDPAYLCTAPARHRRTIRWAYARSVGDQAPFPAI